jgi:hypothetical protein
MIINNMDLATKIYTYYLENLEQLSPDKKFHFGTRLAAWTGDANAYEILRESREYILPVNTSLTETLSKIINAPQTGRRNAQELRQPFFDKYPTLYGRHMALFRVRHLSSVYDVDAREDLFKNVSEEDLLSLRDALLEDEEAIKILSTFAINYLYLLERVIRRDETFLRVDRFYDLGKSYDITDLQQIQLLIYLYTHCIIGESNFYTRLIPASNLGIYIKMLEDLEPLIRDNFDKINLDNKLEFLVCARICGFESHLFTRIYEECSQSVSSEGTFVIDVHNKNAQEDRNGFLSSEHRNVLFIMSTTPYLPHSTIV